MAYTKKAKRKSPEQQQQQQAAQHQTHPGVQQFIFQRIK